MGCGRLFKAAARACALWAMLATAATAPAEDPYYRNGRSVGMGEGGSRIFFTYFNVRYDVVRPLVMDPAQGILQSLRAADGLGGALKLDDAQKRILANVSIRSSTERSLGMSATYSDGRYHVVIPDESAYFISQMATAMIDSGRHQDFGYFNLLIMSQMDWFRQRSPRWYSAATYSAYKGYSDSADKNAIYAQYSDMTALLTYTVLMHELCHHFRNHTTSGARQIAKLRSSGRFAEISRLKVANEIEADKCAAELLAKAGVPPGFAMTASLAISIMMGDFPNSTHPPSAERINRARQLDDRALAVGISRRLIAPEVAGRVGELNDSLLDMLQDYHSRYN